MALFGRAPTAATVSALTPMRVLVAGPESFGTLLSHPAMLRRLATTLASRLRAASSAAS
jgi:CRP-like cAMP-binding protein